MGAGAPTLFVLRCLFGVDACSHILDLMRRHAGGAAGSATTADGEETFCDEGRGGAFLSGATAGAGTEGLGGTSLSSPETDTATTGEGATLLPSTCALAAAVSAADG